MSWPAIRRQTSHLIPADVRKSEPTTSTSAPGCRSVRGSSKAPAATWSTTGLASLVRAGGCAEPRRCCASERFAAVAISTNTGRSTRRGSGSVPISSATPTDRADAAAVAQRTTEPLANRRLAATYAPVPGPPPTKPGTAGPRTSPQTSRPAASSPLNLLPPHLSEHMYAHAQAASRLTYPTLWRPSQKSRTHWIRQHFESFTSVPDSEPDTTHLFTSTQVFCVVRLPRRSV